MRVLLPAQYAQHPRRRYPVLYLLHGSFDTAASWAEKGDAERITDGKPLIVVMPDTAGTGDAGGWASDWSNEGNGGPPKYETYTIRELIPWIDAHYRTRARRGGRSITGLSMGGFSAMSYAVRHPDLFAHAASFSGAVDTNYAPARADRAGRDARRRRRDSGLDLGPAAHREVVWRTHNPWDMAANLEAMTLAIRTGNGQPGPLDDGGLPLDPIEFGVHDMSVSLHQRLEELGLEHVFDDYGAGTHSWPYWQRDLERELPRMMATFRDPPRRPRAFTYTTAEPRFAVYGWRVTRPDGEYAFARLTDVSRRGFAYAGPDRAIVMTARVFKRHSWHTVAVDGVSSAVRAGRFGRLRIAADPGAVVTITR